MELASNSVSQKEYLKKYLSDDGKKKKKKKVKTMSNIKRSQIIDDDIDLKTMRPLDDDEVDLYQMDEDAPQIAGIVDDRPPEVKAQEYYNVKRWKVFGGDDGVNVVDSMDRNQQNVSDLSHTKSINPERKNAESNDKSKTNSLNRPKKKKIRSDRDSSKSSDSDISPVRNNKAYNDTLKRDKHNTKKLKRQKESKSVHDDYDSDLSLTSNHKRKCSDSSPPRKHNRYNSDSDVSLPRMKSSKDKRKKHRSDSDASPPRKYHVDKQKYKGDSDKSPFRREKKNPLNKQRQRSGSDESPRRTDKGRGDRSRYKSEISQRYKYGTDESPSRREKKSSRDKQRQRSDSDESPPRTGKGVQSRYKSGERSRYKGEADKLLPRGEKERSQNKSQKSDSDESPPRTGKGYQLKYKSGDRSRYKGKADTLLTRGEKERSQNRQSQRSDSDESPPRTCKGYRTRYKSDSDNSPSRRENKSSLNKSKHKHNSNESPHSISNEESYHKYESDSNNSLPRKQQKIIRDSLQYKIEKKDIASHGKRCSDSDQSPPRLKERERKTQNIDDRNSKYSSRRTKERSSSRSNSPPRKDKNNSTSYSHDSVKGSQRSSTPPLINKSLQSIKSNKTISPRLSRRDLMDEKNARRRFSDSDDSPPRRKSNSFCRYDIVSDFSPPNKTSSKTKEKMSKKALYIPHDSSSSEERSKNKKMKTTLDGKQAGLQDAKQLRKELSDLRMKEDLVFSNLDASVSGVGAVAIKRDRKTGQVRDLEKEKQAQKEKDAKAAVVKEKYYKWGKGVKQMEDAEVRAAEIMKEMNKPLARYANDEDLDNFLKAQEREGDPMLDFIKQNQKEATALVGEKPIYKGSYTPNRFGIRPGHRWDGVVRSSGYEKEWFAHQNARKARDEDAYKWSTSDM